VIFVISNRIKLFNQLVLLMLLVRNLYGHWLKIVTDIVVKLN
jgi:hypothetical protein